MGAYKSDFLGDNPKNIVGGIVKALVDCSLRQTEQIEIFGGNYDAPDETCIRDFIHIEDLVAGHVAAL